MCLGMEAPATSENVDNTFLKNNCTNVETDKNCSTYCLEGYKAINYLICQENGLWNGSTHCG